MPNDEGKKYDILERIPDALYKFDSVVLEGHDYHHDDNGETFTSSDLRFEMCMQH